MSLPWVVYLLTAGAVVVVVLTRIRLGGRDAMSGQLKISPTLLNVHTVSGGLGLVLWLLFLWTGRGADEYGNARIGIAALAFLWLTSVVGLMLLVRWVPARGKRAAAAVRDRWSDGPLLSLLAHLGMLGGVLVFTWAYLITAV